LDQRFPALRWGGRWDIPSGVDASYGRILGRAVTATCTAAFAFPKVGNDPAGNIPRRGNQENRYRMPRALLETVTDRHLLVDDDVAASLLRSVPLPGTKEPSAIF
jgi:NAD(P)H-hydrate epimerase